MLVGPHPVVSFDEEPLILVNEADQIQGYRSKAACHRGAGLLHRAFSVFLFNSAGALLLQQRSAQKPLWPLFWSNTCCSHPRRGETVEGAAKRRTQEELMVMTPLRFAYKFVYQAPYKDVGSEYELCSVFVGRAASAVEVNANEIAATCFMAPDKLDSALQDINAPYTPWLRLEWPRLRQTHWELISGIVH